MAAEGMDAKGGMDAAGGKILAVGRTTVAGSLGACFFASSFFSFSSSSMSSMSHLLKVGGSMERVDSKKTLLLVAEGWTGFPVESLTGSRRVEFSFSTSVMVEASVEAASEPS